MKNVFLAAVVIFIGFASEGFAQAAKREWTLKECVDIALENNLRIKRSIYNVETFKTNLMQAKGGFLPTLNLQGGYSSNYGRGLNPVTNLFVDRNSNTLNLSGQASLIVFNGLRVTNTFKQSQRDVIASDYDLQKAKNDVILNVVNLYTNVIFNQELYDNAKYQLNSSQQQLDRITKQVEAGSLSRANQLNQEALVATNELNLINQENILNLSFLQLKQAMQIPGSEVMVIQIPDLALEDLVLDQSAESVYNVALQTMPEIKSAILKLESAELAMKATKGNYYPRLSLNASATSNYSSLNNVARYDFSNFSNGYVVGKTPQGVVGTTNDFVYGISPNPVLIAEKYSQVDQLKDNLYKIVSLSLNIPILNGFQTRTGVQRAIISKEVASITIKETENTLRQSIETAYNDANAASRSYSSSLKQVKAQEEAYRMNKQRFDVGALSIIEYQISENDLYRAKSDLTRAKYNFIFKKKVLDFYQGKQIEY